MRAGVHQKTSLAPIAGVEPPLPRRFAEQGFGQLLREAAFADAGGADEEIRVRQPVARDDLAESVEAVLMAEDGGPGHAVTIPPGIAALILGLLECSSSAGFRGATFHARLPAPRPHR